MPDLNGVKSNDEKNVVNQDDQLNEFIASLFDDLMHLTYTAQNTVIEKILKRVREKRAERANEISKELNLIESSLTDLSDMTL